MKKTIKSIIVLLSAFILLAADSCTHEIDGLEEVTSYPATAEVFIDAFPSDLDYAAFGYSDVKAFTVDTEVKYKGAASMKIAVPDVNDPNGSYAGGAYYSTFGRDLSGYNCLTFWAKATKRASVDEIGFGVDMGENKYKVSIFGLAVNTNWKKYYIPIPAPARLKSEKGLFFFGEGPEEGMGYTFWIDEVKFENLGTIAHPQPKILNGADSITSAFIGVDIPIGNGSETFNLPDGTNRDLAVSVSCFDFSSSNENVATVSDEGVVTVQGPGRAVISAEINGLKAAGTLTVNAIGPATAEVFTDSLAVDLQYEPFEGSKEEAFEVDNKIKHSGASSIKITVPHENDPNGSYAGGAYYSNIGRDLTGYNCLTFWAKAEKQASIDEVGFGIDLGENKYQVSTSGLAVDTDWKKYFIPVPVPARLKLEKGMFFFSEKMEDGRGYTFWIDEVKFENLENITPPQPKILNGKDSTISASIGQAGITVGSGSATFNLPDGKSLDMTVAASCFDFFSNNESVATVGEGGVITVLGLGSADITAKMNGTIAAGKLTLITDTFPHAPEPALDPDRVISIFSDAYPNVQVDFFNDYWEWQTTRTVEFSVNGDSVLSYTGFNFFGIGFPAIDASAMSHIHFDVFVPEGTTGAKLKIKLLDFGPNGDDNAGDGDDGSAIDTFDLVPGQWNQLEMSIESMRPRDKVRLIAYDNDEGPFSNFYLDNIYFYKEE